MLEYLCCIKQYSVFHSVSFCVEQYLGIFHGIYIMLNSILVCFIVFQGIYAMLNSVLMYFIQINHCLQSRLFPALPPDPLDLECIRLYISLPLFFLLYSQDCNNYRILLPYSSAFLSLSKGAKNMIGELCLSMQSVYVLAHYKLLYAGNIRRGQIWQTRGNLPNFYPPNILVLPSNYLVKVSSPIFYHLKVKEMCIRQYFAPPNISRVRYEICYNLGHCIERSPGVCHSVIVYR